MWVFIFIKYLHVVDFRLLADRHSGIIFQTLSMLLDCFVTLAAENFFCTMYEKSVFRASLIPLPHFLFVGNH